MTVVPSNESIELANQNTDKSSVAGAARSAAPGAKRTGAGRWLLGSAGSLAVTVLVSAILVFSVELIVRGSFSQTLAFFEQPFRPGWTTVVLFALLLIGLDALLGRRHNGLLVVAPVLPCSGRDRPPEVALSRRSPLPRRFSLFPPDPGADAASGARAAVHRRHAWPRHDRSACPACCAVALLATRFRPCACTCA